ncbi:MAG: hypothetical protein WAO21_08820 [Verrucomicrobiia bacterium]
MDDTRTKQFAAGIKPKKPVGEPEAGSPSQIHHAAPNKTGFLHGMKLVKSQSKNDFQGTAKPGQHSGEKKESSESRADFLNSIQSRTGFWRNFIRIHDAKNKPINSVSQVFFIV